MFNFITLWSILKQMTVITDDGLPSDMLVCSPSQLHDSSLGQSISGHLLKSLHLFKPMQLFLQLIMKFTHVLAKMASLT